MTLMTIKRHANNARAQPCRRYAAPYPKYGILGDRIDLI